MVENSNRLVVPGRQGFERDMVERFVGVELVSATPVDLITNSTMRYLAEASVQVISSEKAAENGKEVISVTEGFPKQTQLYIHESSRHTSWAILVSSLDSKAVDSSDFEIHLFEDHALAMTKYVVRTPGTKHRG